MLIEHAGLARRGQDVAGHDLPGRGIGHQQPPAGLGHGDALADQPGRHRIAGRPEPDAGEPVYFPGHRGLADGRAQRRQRGQQVPLGLDPLGGDRADLRVRDAVHLRAPLAGRDIGRSHIGERGLRDDQVPLGVADQVLHDPLGRRRRLHPIQMIGTGVSG
jgi:hypothetical protein